MNTKLLRQLALGIALGGALAACDRDTNDATPPSSVTPGTANPSTPMPPAMPTEPAKPSTNLPDSSSVGAPERAPVTPDGKREQGVPPTPGTPETKP
jgi:hypothetical protein